MFSRFDTVPACDEQAGRRTFCDSVGCAMRTHREIKIMIKIMLLSTWLLGTIGVISSVDDLAVSVQYRNVNVLLAYFPATNLAAHST